jgi:hypothetical protein
MHHPRRLPRTFSMLSVMGLLAAALLACDPAEEEEGTGTDRNMQSGFCSKPRCVSFGASHPLGFNPDVAEAICCYSGIEAIVECFDTLGNVKALDACKDMPQKIFAAWGDLFRRGLVSTAPPTSLPALTSCKMPTTGVLSGTIYYQSRAGAAWVKPTGKWVTIKGCKNYSCTDPSNVVYTATLKTTYGVYTTSAANPPPTNLQYNIYIDGSKVPQRSAVSLGCYSDSSKNGTFQVDFYCTGSSCKPQQ